MRAFFANGVEKMHVPWAVEGLPMLLHLSLFLFFGGLVILLFNTDKGVFISVVWWIGPFSMVYGLFTFLPIIRHDSPYNTPLSAAAWFLYASMQYATAKVLNFMNPNIFNVVETRRRHYLSMLRDGTSRGMEKAAEETVLGRSSEIDIRIFDWTINALGDDDTLEKFFEAIPGFFNSTLVEIEKDIPWTLLRNFWGVLHGFMDRTMASNSVAESVKFRRVINYRQITNMVPCPIRLMDIMEDNLRSSLDQLPISIESVQTITRWFTNTSVGTMARITAAQKLARIQERDDRWIALASVVYGLSEGDLQDNVALGGDNVLLATLIEISRRALHSHDLGLVETLTMFNIRHTLPGLQHGFCTLWNELVQAARNQRHGTIPVAILTWIRHLYIALHQGTDAAPSAFSDHFESVQYPPPSYQLCNVLSHRADSIAHISATGISKCVVYVQS